MKGRVRSTMHGLKHLLVIDLNRKESGAISARL